MTRDERLSAMVRAYLRTPDAQWRVSRRPIGRVEWRFEAHPGRHMQQAWRMVSWGDTEAEAIDRAEAHLRSFGAIWAAAAEAAVAKEGEGVR